MRDAFTTAMEVVGMMLLCVAAAIVVGSAAVALAGCGTVLVAAGVREGRK